MRRIINFLILVLCFLCGQFVTFPIIRRYNRWRYYKLLQATQHHRQDDNNGIYYFLGNFHQHMSHVMPLYKLIGGEVVVLSESAKVEVEKYGAKCVCIDDNNDIWLNLDEKVNRTLSFLNKEARIVILHEAFIWDGVELTAPSLWLNHGLGAVKMDNGWDARLRELNKLTAVATLGRLGKKALVGRVDSVKMVDLSPARIDELINISLMREVKKSGLKKLLNIPAGKEVIAYMPTYWGSSSVEDTGIQLIKRMPENKVVIFWPHPQTPKNVLNRYRNVLKSHKNVLDAQSMPNLSIGEVYKLADKYIIDPSSSVVVDAILLGKQIFFSFGQDKNFDYLSSQSALRDLLKSSKCITGTNVQNINSILNEKDSLRTILLKYQLISKFTWYPNGGATGKILEVINNIMRDYSK